MLHNLEEDSEEDAEFSSNRYYGMKATLKEEQ